MTSFQRVLGGGVTAPMLAAMRVAACLVWKKCNAKGPLEGPEPREPATRNAGMRGANRVKDALCKWVASATLSR